MSSAKNASTSSRVALILCGSGVQDGTEITEGVSALVQLSRRNAAVEIFAPDKPQMHVINHVTGEEMKGEERNCLVESARIARGKVSPLSKCSADDFDAIVIPGGFGAAKNLSDFAVNGEKMVIDEDMDRLIKEFTSQKKVIGLCCISPTIAAKAIPGVTVTMGKDEESDGAFPFAGACGAVNAMGATHVNTEPQEAYLDKKHLVVTSAAYMYNGKPHEIANSVTAMVDGVLNLVQERNK